MSDIPEKPTPFVEYSHIVSEDTTTAVLTHITKGQRKKSRIFHTKETGNLYFEYSERNCNRDKFRVLCIYSESKNKGKCISSFYR